MRTRGCAIGPGGQRTGASRGASFARFRKLGHLLHPDHNRKFIGFDVFGRFPGTSYEPDKPYLKEQIESDGEISIPRAEQMRLLDEQGLGDNVELVEGDVCETLPEWLASRQEMSFAIINLDLDLYEPTKVAIECLFPRVARGGIIPFDDYEGFPGSKRAVDDDLAANRRPERLSKFPFAMSPCYLIKE